MNGRATSDPIMAAMRGHHSRSSDFISLPKRTLRILGVFWHLVLGLLTAALAFPFYNAWRRHRAIRLWSVRLLRQLGVRLRVEGALTDSRPLLLVAAALYYLVALQALLFLPSAVALSPAEGNAQLAARSISCCM